MSLGSYVSAANKEKKSKLYYVSLNTYCSLDVFMHDGLVRHSVVPGYVAIQSLPKS